MIYGRFWLVGITMTALIIVTSTPFVPAASPAKQITVVQSAEPKSLDPSVEVLTHSISVYSQIVENLVWFTHDLKPDPKLAVSWKNTDPLTWEVRLRAAVRRAISEAGSCRVSSVPSVCCSVLASVRGELECLCAGPSSASDRTWETGREIFRRRHPPSRRRGYVPSSARRSTTPSRSMSSTRRSSSTR